MTNHGWEVRENRIGCPMCRRGVVTSRYRDGMAAITVRLSDDDHKLLQLYCLMTGKSQNTVLTDLLHAELDRALPGKRDAVANHDPQAFWQAIGIAPPEATPEADGWARGVINSLSDESGQTAA